ncbi:MAG TPA: hypothetical protein VJU61_28905 [Polyangiaceae bacterium]|nr:hypothetical protein [Polyangiaceae bacterium]
MKTTNQCLRASRLLAGGLLLGGALIGGCGGEAEDALDDADFETLSEELVSNPLTPVLTCMDDLGRNNYKAHFGYTNSSSTKVKVPIGVNNFFVPLPKNQGQPTEFAPGNRPDVFQVTFSTRDGWDRLAWWLNGRRALATRRTPICPPPPPQCTTAADCNDDKICTTDSCTGGRCSNTPSPPHTSCPHGNVCDGAGACVPCLTDVDCNDLAACTTDVCANSLCTHGSAPAGTACGGTHGVCDGAGQCVSPQCTGDVDCNDDNSCTSDVCTSGICSHPPAEAHTPCAHGNVCDGAGACVPCLTDVDCNDLQACTTDACVNSLCTHGNAPSTTPCGRPGHFCTGTGTCSP